ncbi:hypothetical protein AAFF27_11750 [Xylophilus sp. GW821-FHT01B05]
MTDGCEGIGVQRKAQAAAQALRLGKGCNAAMRGEGKRTPADHA